MYGIATLYTHNNRLKFTSRYIQATACAYAEIFEGCKICGELKETMYSNCMDDQQPDDQQKTMKKIVTTPRCRSTSPLAIIHHLVY